ncbi:hypothetical protein BGP89_14195 [Luteimonas sp. JM171]|nr:hypothetical protein [Luteimonas sp. JM171]
MEKSSSEIPLSTDVPQPVVLAIASVDTKGTNKIGEDMGGFWAGGISQE